jgi:hypothetical protein
MTELAIQLTEAHLRSKGFDRPDQVPATLEQQPVLEISVLRFVLVATILLGTNIWIATRLQGDRERAFLFAAVGAAGVPIFQSSPFVCRSASSRTSAVHLARVKMLSLLAGN